MHLSLRLLKQFQHRFCRNHVINQQQGRRWAWARTPKPPSAQTKVTCDNRPDPMNFLGVSGLLSVIVQSVRLAVQTTSTNSVQSTKSDQRLYIL